MSMAGSCNLGVRLRTLSCTATVRERSLGHLDRTRQCSSQGMQPSAKSSQAGRPDLDDLAKVGERAGQPVDLVDDDDVDSPRLDLDQMKEQLAAGLSEWQISRKRKGPARHDPTRLA